MKRVMKSVMAAVVMLTLVLAGCGNTEVVMKEFTSEDGTVSIQFNEKWEQEDMGSGAEGWIAGVSENGSDAVMVMQMAKNIYGTNIADMDDWKDMINAFYPMSEMTSIDNPSVPGMDVAETYRCSVTVENITGEGRILYGETEYAYYSILYVAVKMNAADEEYFNNVCASFKEAAPEIGETAAAESTDTIQWFNNTCAVLTAANRWDYTLFGGAPADDNSKSMVQSLLSEWWDVTDRETAEETMDWILEEGHRVSFAEDLDTLAEAGLAEVSEAERADWILENFEVSDEEAQNYADWFAFYEQYGSDAAAGWDYSRAMSLLGYYYLAGYYTEEEALDQSMETAVVIQSTFDSWDDFMESYFLGYEYWAEESSDERRALYEEIKASSDSPFQLDWGMTFEKTW